MERRVAGWMAGRVGLASAVLRCTGRLGMAGRMGLAAAALCKVGLAKSRLGMARMGMAPAALRLLWRTGRLARLGMARRLGMA
jgi:hypothetical protein